MYKTITFEYNDLLKSFVQIQENWFNTIEDATNDLNHLKWSQKKNKMTNREYYNMLNQKYGYGHWKYVESKRQKTSKAKVMSVYNTKLKQTVMYTTLVTVNDKRERSQFIQDKIFEKISNELSENIQKEINESNPFKVN